MYRAITACRICGNANLIPVLAIGEQALTGVFPKDPNKNLTVGPLTLVKCVGDRCCGLLQLAHSYSLEEMYGENYGYRSGLNPSMVAHLKSKVDRIKSYGIIADNDIILDVGANDGTTLKQYNLKTCQLVGIDPTAEKFREHYTSEIYLLAEFFSAKLFRETFGDAKAKIVTSFSMFYDMEDPITFMREVYEILKDDGIWVFEQSYMPSMLATNSYDTICHEHLEYYALSQILWMAERVGFKIVDVELNAINGGSFSVVAQKSNGPMNPFPSVARLIADEKRSGIDNLLTYSAFEERVKQSRFALLAFLEDARAKGKRVAALGASTKGNVILQYCNIDTSLIYAVGEVNSDKFGAFTPGSRIPIFDETRILADKPEHFLVLPWHFRNYFESQPRYAGLDLYYPLPFLSRRR